MSSSLIKKELPGSKKVSRLKTVANGFMIDARNAPRQIQELAYEKGMIPYIPDDKA